eukprot:scaffold489_cov309-Pavlova_lutheri.AAC.3
MAGKTSAKYEERAAVAACVSSECARTRLPIQAMVAPITGATTNVLIVNSGLISSIRTSMETSCSIPGTRRCRAAKHMSPAFSASAVRRYVRSPISNPAAPSPAFSDRCNSKVRMSADCKCANIELRVLCVLRCGPNQQCKREDTGTTCESDEVPLSESSSHDAELRHGDEQCCQCYSCCAPGQQDLPPGHERGQLQERIALERCRSLLKRPRFDATCRGFYASPFVFLVCCPGRLSELLSDPFEGRGSFLPPRHRGRDAQRRACRHASASVLGIDTFPPCTEISISLIDILGRDLGNGPLALPWAGDRRVEGVFSLRGVEVSHGWLVASDTRRGAKMWTSSDRTAVDFATTRLWSGPGSHTRVLLPRSASLARAPRAFEARMGGAGATLVVAFTPAPGPGEGDPIPRPRGQVPLYSNAARPFPPSPPVLVLASSPASRTLALPAKPRAFPSAPPRSSIARRCT